MPKVTELWAWVIEDTGPDDEGIPAHLGLTGMWEPLVGADRERAESLRVEAQQMATIHGKPIRLLRSTDLVEVEVIQP